MDRARKPVAKREEREVQRDLEPRTVEPRGVGQPDGGASDDRKVEKAIQRGETAWLTGYDDASSLCTASSTTGPLGSTLTINLVLLFGPGQLIWFQGHHRHLFDPYMYRKPEIKAVANPVFSSLEELSEASRFSAREVSRILDTLVKLDWLDSLQFPLRVKRKEELLTHLCALGLTRPVRGYSVHLEPDALYCYPVRHLSKMYVVPVSGRLVIRNRFHIGVFFEQALSKSWREKSYAWGSRVQTWSSQSFHSKNKELPLIFHDFKNPGQLPDRIDVSAKDEHMRMHFEPCELQEANVIRMDSTMWSRSVMGSVSHMGDLPSVDLLQCYIDLHNLSEKRPDLEDSTVLAVVRDYLTGLPLGSGLSFHEDTT